MKEEELINLREYSYGADVPSTAKGKIVTDFLQFLELLIEKETNYETYLETFPNKVEPKTIINDNQEESLESVDIEWTQYPTAESFFRQVPIKTMSKFGALAVDMKMRIDTLHLMNIQDGIATKKQDGTEL